MTIRDMLEFGIEFQSGATVKVYDFETEHYPIRCPLCSAFEYYDLRILYIYQYGDEIVIGVVTEE